MKEVLRENERGQFHLSGHLKELNCLDLSIVASAGI